MSKERYLNTKFWDDNYIVNKDPIEKLLFIYLLTNPLTNLIGIYEISLKRIAFDTGIDTDMVLKILERFEKDSKVKYFQGFIAIKNFTKHQKNNPKINKGIEMLVNEVPLELINWVNIDRKRFNIPDSLYIDYDRLSHPNPNPNPNPNKDKERQAPSLNQPKKAEEPLEFSFEDKEWYGLTDWRIKMYQGKFPMLSINYLFNDVYKTKFLSDPKRYKKEIEESGGIEKLLWKWLGQDKKFYLQNHPEYSDTSPPMKPVNKLGRNMGHISETLKEIKLKGG